MHWEVYVAGLCGVSAHTQEKLYQIDSTLEHSHEMAPVHKESQSSSGRVRLHRIVTKPVHREKEAQCQCCLN